MIDPLSNETLGAGMIVDVEGREETRGQVSASDRATRFGNRPAVIALDDAEAACAASGTRALTIAERWWPLWRIYRRRIARALAKAAGLIVIVTGFRAPNAIDASRLATHEALSILERRGILIGRKEQLLGAKEFSRPKGSSLPFVKCFSKASATVSGKMSTQCPGS